ncbi:MAG: aldo/keto reductase [Chloroflexi bacterium]|nr:aldo/keto reductase [Chloroflexota bacterium]
MADIMKRTLGRTGEQVTALAYGAMELRGAPRGRDISPDDAGVLLNAVLDGGINFIDTSIDYGVSEELIGKYISGRRNEYFLASKCGCWASEGEPPPSEGGRFPHIYTRENIIAGVEQSLRRMNTDHLDLVQLHGSPTQAVLEQHGAVDTMLDLQKQGKIRFLGMSGTHPNLPDHINMGVFDAFQIPYSAVEREHEGAMSEASKAGAGIIIRGGVAKGDPGGEGHGGDRWEAWDKANLNDLLEGMTRTQFMLRFTITNPDLDTTIVGTASIGHLADNLKTMELGTLSTDVYDEAKRRLSGVA